ncbi:uncharacterized protein LOC128357691 [Scomber scombrus]|uniref:Uncharacterized protein LOC128357691 n=1 Tax=Scomber scombrus TaxID=13677 RepID=A0AAV1QDX1_SCOSC
MILRPFLTSAPTASTTTQSFRRSSTSSTFSAQTTNQSEKEQTEKTTAGGVLLYVRLTLVIIVILFSVAVLIHKKRASKPKEHPEETECVNVTEASPVYEEIREGDGRSRSPPVENSVEASAVYSLVTATASRPLSKTEDDLTEVDYTEVDFSNRAAVSLSSAPSGQVDNVIYSTPQTHTDAKVASQPLYSTITLPQQKL